MTTGIIYTSEPMATRALAAEIRHDPRRLTTLLETRLGLAVGGLGDLTSVRCEGAGNLDIVLGYTKDTHVTTVGIEAKLDHEVTREQIVKEQAEVDHLALVLPEATDAPGWLPTEVPAVSWAAVLDCFDEPRLTAVDIASVPLLKVTVERTLARHAVPGWFPAGWSVVVHRGGAGMPSIEITSPPLADGRVLRGQVQTYGRGLPATLAEVRFEYHVGVQVNRDDIDLPPEPGPTPPLWITHVRLLNDRVLGDDLNDWLVSRTAPSAGQSQWGKRKMLLVREFLPDATWLAKGYTDGWALGIKSKPTPVEGLGDLCATTTKIFTAWFAAEQEAAGAEADPGPD